VRPTSSINPFTLVFLFTSLLHVEEEDEDEDEDEDVFVFVFVLTRPANFAGCGASPHFS
jgi:hypothetical protein